jgi:hypothetical protein
VYSESVELISFGEIHNVPVSVSFVFDGQTTDAVFGQVATERNIETFCSMVNLT